MKREHCTGTDTQKPPSGHSKGHVSPSLLDSFPSSAFTLLQPLWPGSPWIWNISAVYFQIWEVQPSCSWVLWYCLLYTKQYFWFSPTLVVPSPTQQANSHLSDSACGNLTSKTTRTHPSEGKPFLNLLNSTSRGGENCRVSPSPLAEVITHSGFLAHASTAVLIPPRQPRVAFSTERQTKSSTHSSV